MRDTRHDLTTNRNCCLLDSGIQMAFRQGISWYGLRLVRQEICRMTLQGQSDKSVKKLNFMPFGYVSPLIKYTC